MANFTTQMLADLLKNPNYEDEEFKRKAIKQLQEMQFDPQSYTGNPTDTTAQLAPVAPTTASNGIPDDIMTGGTEPIPLSVGGNPFAQAAARRQMYGPGDTTPIRSGSGSFSSGAGTSGQLQSKGGYDELAIRRGENIRVLDQMRQKDGSIFQLIEEETPRGMVKSTRVVMPPENDPFMQQAQKYRKGEADIAAMSTAGIEAKAAAEERGKTEADQARRAALTPQQRAAEDFKRAGGKLSPDQEVDPDTGEVRARKGSKLHLKQNTDFANDAASVQTLKSTAMDVNKKVNQLLNDKDGFTSLFGGYNAEYVTKYLPGAQDARKKLTEIQAALMTAGKNIATTGGTSIGQITEREWPILQQQISALGSMNSEAEAESALKYIGERLEGMATMADQRHKATWGDTQFTRDKSAPATGKEVTMEDVFQAAKKTGKSIDQVKKDAVAKGYSVRGM